MNQDHSAIFETVSKQCISDPFVDSQGYSFSSKGILVHRSRYYNTLNYIHLFPSILVYWFLKCLCSLLHFLFDHFQFTLTHGPNIPGSYATLFYMASDFAFTSRLCFHLQTTGCCLCFGSGFSLLMALFLHSFPVAYWAPTYLGSSSFSVISFCLFILFMGFSWRPFNISEYLF